MLQREDFARALRRGAADQPARVPLPDRPGVRLGRRSERRLSRWAAPIRRSTSCVGRDSPAGPRARSRRWPDGAAPRRARRRPEDVEELGNYVGINEKPEDIYGKLMSVSDALMWRYFELLTRIPRSRDSPALRSATPEEAKKRVLARDDHRAVPRRARRCRGGEHSRARIQRDVDVPDEIDAARVPGAPSRRGRPPEARAWPVWLVLKEAGLVPLDVRSARA